MFRYMKLKTVTALADDALISHTLLTLFLYNLKDEYKDQVYIGFPIERFLLLFSK
jgi:hypothetical protein